MSDNQNTYSPRLTCDFHRGVTYNTAGSLALVVGINVAFISHIAKHARGENGMLLWSDPKLVSLLMQVRNAFRRGDGAKEAILMGDAVHYANSYLPEGGKLPSNAILRLVWAPYGYASVTYTERSDGTPIDVVKCGRDTDIICAPANSDSASMALHSRMRNEVWVDTGSDKISHALA